MRIVNSSQYNFYEFFICYMWRAKDLYILYYIKNTYKLR